MKVLSILTLGFIMPWTCCHAQIDTTGNWHLIPTIQYGTILPHRASMQNVIIGHSTGMSLQLMRRRPFSYWGMYHRQPVVGWDWYLSSTGNPEQLGYQTGLSYLMYKPFFSTGKNHIPRLYWGTGVGVGYSTKKWDMENNHQSPVLSTHFNACLTLHLQGVLFSTAFHQLNLGLRITHLSNGATVIPNLGTNNIQLGLSYFPKMGLSSQDRCVLAILMSYHKNLGFNYFQSVGTQQVYQPNGRNYVVHVGRFQFSKRVKENYRITLGTDLFYKPAIAQLRNKNLHETTEPNQLWQVGITAGIETVYGHTTLGIEQGYYLITAWKGNGMLYHRFGLRRQIGNTKKWSVGLHLFTHFAKADHIECALGYTIF